MDWQYQAGANRGSGAKAASRLESPGIPVLQVPGHSHPGGSVSPPGTPGGFGLPVSLAKGQAEKKTFESAGNEGAHWQMSSLGSELGTRSARDGPWHYARKFSAQTRGLGEHAAVAPGALGVRPSRSHMMIIRAPPTSGASACAAAIRVIAAPRLQAGELSSVYFAPDAMVTLGN
jgi:hypothetical protein